MQEDLSTCSKNGCEHLTGVYSNAEIKKAVNLGQIVIHPLVERHICGSSVDVTLGEWYFETDRESAFGVYNPYDEDAVKEYFGEAKKAKPYKDYKLARTLGYSVFNNIPEDHPIILLEPGERVLAHTHEFIGIRPPRGTTSMQARSTTGRNGISVCLDAGWGDPGYVNRWTMEITNVNKRHAVPLPVGERVAQIVFYHTGLVEGEYAALSGNYQADSAGEDIATLVEHWRPEQMLPRAYKDERRKPLPL